MLCRAPEVENQLDGTAESFEQRGWQAEDRDVVVAFGRVQSPVVQQQMEARVVGQRHARARSGTILQTPPDVVHDWPPASTGAQGSCAGNNQPVLALWNSQRLPSSRQVSASAPLAGIRSCISSSI
jgi:hypothetical protein